MPLDSVNKETGWLSKWAFQHGSLAADSVGREAMADGYITAAKFSTMYIRLIEYFNKILAVDTDVIRNNEDLSAAIPITFTLDAQPDVPRVITLDFNSHAQITAYTLTITGTDAKGATISETFTQADGWALVTSRAFATITSIALSARTGTGAGDTMDVGIGQSLGLANNIAAAAQVYKIVKSAAAGNAGDLAAADYTAEATYDTVDVGVGAAIVDGDSFTIYYKANLADIT